jgi:hypothetical protein
VGASAIAKSVSLLTRISIGWNPIAPTSFFLLGGEGRHDTLSPFTSPPSHPRRHSRLLNEEERDVLNSSPSSGPESFL